MAGDKLRPGWESGGKVMLDLDENESVEVEILAGPAMPLVKSGHLEAAAIALASASDAPSAIDLIKNGSKAAGIRAIEEHYATYPTPEDYQDLEP